MLCCRPGQSLQLQYVPGANEVSQPHCHANTLVIQILISVAESDSCRYATPIKASAVFGNCRASIEKHLD
jgi:hypothetical protein